MRKLFTLLTTVLVIVISITPLQAQLFEDFEDGEKTFYSGASVTLSTGDWYMEDALIGNLGNDKYNGSQGVRMDRRNSRTGNIYMEFDKPNGADEVSFFLAHYGDRAEDAALQVQYSLDGGSSWTDVGDEITAPADLTEYTIPVEQSGDIRFKFIQSSGTDRMNIDDIRVTDYIEPAEEPTIAVSVEGEGIDANADVSFSATPTNSSRTKDIQIKNFGSQELLISEVNVTGNGFTISEDLADSSLSFNEEAMVTLTFSPGSEGPFQGQVSIESNATNQSTFTLNLIGEGFTDGSIIPISEARQVDFGTRVTVAGRVTVANEFEGPAHIQDNTAAIAVYWPALHTAVELGDSVVVTGPITEFNPVDGPQGDFLLQIAEHQGDDNITFDVIDVEPKEVEPTLITIEEMNSGDYESQLVKLNEVIVDHNGSFQGETNYDISDRSGSGLIRIDGDANLVGVEAPSDPVTIIGVVDQFFGDYQLKPRSAEDIGAEEVTFPGDDISKDLTFEIVTWNIEWFGDGSNGPSDDDQQLANVIEVIREIDAEIYAFQEISNQSYFAALLDTLDEYGGILADFSQDQKTAFLFKRSEIDSLSSDKITESMTSNYWAGGNNNSFARFPLMFQFNATINGESREIYAFNIHAKATSEPASYTQRFEASREIKQYLDQLHNSDNVILIGDYNDTVNGSITDGEESPYKNFVDDEEYTVITQSLEEQGFASQSIGSFIDHITMTSELTDEYIAGTERVENTNYIGSYLSSTSDHYPVWTRFQFEMVVSNEGQEENPVSFSLAQNYPNPFNPSTVINYQLAENSTVTLEVFDMLGREVATLVNSERMTAGNHQVSFDAGNLSSGLYLYRLSTLEGQQITKKMMLLK
ncbi:MAG: T9SS type A sorting domain-containing protein [Gracilimonas sp.]|nr:T9SS type A sorting domain-containing protein [Gracilimonas sp.]